MSQKENFTLGTHYFLKGVAKAGISFPSTKADCVIRARNIQIRTDYDKYESLASSSRPSSRTILRMRTLLWQPMCVLLPRNCSRRSASTKA